MNNKTRMRLLWAIVRFRLIFYAITIMRLTSSSPRLTAAPAEDEALPVGVSKLGGCPDLPEGVTWPREEDKRTRRRPEYADNLYGDNTPLPFVAQINLNEVAAWDDSGTLPKAGIVSVFYSGYTGGWRLLFSEGTPLIRQEFPEDLDYGSRHPCYSLTPGRKLTLPDLKGHSEPIPGREREQSSFYRNRRWWTFAEKVPVFDTELRFVERELSRRRLGDNMSSNYVSMKYSFFEDNSQHGITYHELFDFRAYRGVRDEWGLLLGITGNRDLTDYRKCGTGAHLCIWARWADLLSKDFSRVELTAHGGRSAWVKRS